MPIDHRSYCRICAAACGIIVTVEGIGWSRVRGDADHPVSRGYVCSKGRGPPDWHHAPGRLGHPLLRGEVVGWDDLLDDLARVMRHRIDEHGPDAIALYLATGLAYDSAGRSPPECGSRAIGGSSFYTAATVDNAPILVAAELVTGQPMLEPGLGSVVARPAAPRRHQPGRVAPATARPCPTRCGTSATSGRPADPSWVLDPRRRDRRARRRPRPGPAGSDVEVLAGSRALLHDGADPTELVSMDDIAALRAALAPFTVERASRAAGVSEAALHAAGRRHAAAHPGRVAAFCGTGTTMARDGVVVEWLRWVILVLTGSLDRPGGMRFNRGAVNRLRPPRGERPVPPGPRSRPDLPHVAGQVPSVALADEIEAGNVRILVVTGGNPLAAFPEPDRLRAALSSLDALVVIDVVETELTELATHVLPAAGQLERADLSLAEHVALRSGVQADGRPVVPPVDERRSSRWMLASLAQRLGRELPGGADPDALTDEDFLRELLAHGPLDPDEVFRAGSHGVDVPVEHGWVRASMLPEGRWRIAPASMLARLAQRSDVAAPALVLTPRRQMAWSNSIRYGRDAHDAARIVRLHPDDASQRGLADGELATVASEHGSLVATVACDDLVRRGVASVTHGHDGRSPGLLTSAAIDVDPLTTMPLASGLAVTIRPADEAATA